MAASANTVPIAVVGRYSIHAEIAHGGMATVHLGRLLGSAGFSRIVAIKRLHAQYAKDPEFVAMLMDEARLASRIRHQSVVSIIDVVAARGELLLVMDYVQGESLSTLVEDQRKQNGGVDPRIASKIMTEVLAGLHAAHEACGDHGEPLGIVHRDVSPQNILVGVDGVSQVIDFGVAKAVGRVQSTREGQLKGKLAYMSPEQIRGRKIDRRTDIYAASVVLWEILTGRRLFSGDKANTIYGVLTEPVPPPSSLNPALRPGLDAVVLKGLNKKIARRYGTALEMADALEEAMPSASSREVARWIEGLAAKTLEERAILVAEVESASHAWGLSTPERASGIPSDVPTRGQVAAKHAVANAASEEASSFGSGSERGSGASVQPRESGSLEPGSVASTGSSMGSVNSVMTKRAGWWRAIGIAAGVILFVAGTWLVARGSAPARPDEQNAAGGVVSMSSPPERVPSDPPEGSSSSVASSGGESAVSSSSTGSRTPVTVPEAFPVVAASGSGAGASSSRTVLPPPVLAPVESSTATVRGQPRPTNESTTYTRD